MSLPITGQLNWGVPLNDYITNAVLAVANSALTGLSTHESASDPHGDRAYAAGLVNPITTGTNLPNGYVKLDSTGRISATLLPSGSGLSNYYDVKSNYGATGNGSTDDSAAIQHALNDCATAGGGEVWLGDGTYACGTQLIIGANTWLHLSPGAIIKRIIPVVGSAPSIMIANVNFTTGTGTPATGNILISGGKWDAVGSGLASNCTPIFLCQASFAAVEQTYFNGIAANPLIELNGSTYITVRDCVFTGASLSSGGGLVPAVRLNSSSAATTPAGMAGTVYNNSVCSEIVVAACTLVNTGAHSSTNKLVSADLFVSGHTHNVVTVYGCSTAGSTTDAYPPADFTNVVQGVSYGNLWDVAADNPVLDLTTTGNLVIGPSSASGTPPDVYVAGQLVYATGYPGNFTGETWHTMSLQNGFSSGNDTLGNNYTPKYRLNADGSVSLRGALVTPSGNCQGTTLANLPTAYESTYSNPPTAIVADQSGSDTGVVYLTTGGDLRLHGDVATNTSNATVYLDCTLRRA
jgi:hypothetical protein